MDRWAIVCIVLALYIASAILGGGLVLLAAFGGVFGHQGGDGVGPDVGGHDGLELGHTHGGMAHSHDGLEHGIERTLEGGQPSSAGGSFFIPFFSLRFWTYFVAGFGALGTLLTVFRQSTEPVTGIVSGILGLILGLIAAYSWRLLDKQQSDANTKSGDFIGTIGKLSVASRETNLGKVRVSVRGELIDMIAVSDDGTTIESGEEVVIVGIEGDRARVVRKGDFLN